MAEVAGPRTGPGGGARRACRSTRLRWFVSRRPAVIVARLGRGARRWSSALAPDLTRLARRGAGDAPARSGPRAPSPRRCSRPAGPTSGSSRPPSSASQPGGLDRADRAVRRSLAERVPGADGPPGRSSPTSSPPTPTPEVADRLLSDDGTLLLILRRRRRLLRQPDQPGGRRLAGAAGPTRLDRAKPEGLRSALDRRGGHRPRLHGKTSSRRSTAPRSPRSSCCWAS